jgi:dTDP-4-dehydrorhamnose 3,5-epimerase
MSLPLIEIANSAIEVPQLFLRSPAKARVPETQRMSLASVAAAADLPRILVPKRHLDDRGWFSETFHEKRLCDLGIPCHFVQDNQSCSTRAGTLRGFHFQIPPAAQAKLVSVVRGRIIDVAVDLRCGSPTFGKHVAAEISDVSNHQVYIPVGFAHGLLTLDNETQVFYKVSDFYSPSHERGIRWDDPDIGFAWPIPPAAMTISEKDRALPSLKDFESPFAYDGHPLAAMGREL